MPGSQGLDCEKPMTERILRNREALLGLLRSEFAGSAVDCYDTKDLFGTIFHIRTDRKLLIAMVSTEALRDLEWEGLLRLLERDKAIERLKEGESPVAMLRDPTG